MNWRAHILKNYDAREREYSCYPKFYPKASDRAVAVLQSSLDLELPSDLVELLRQTNGVMNVMELENGRVIETGWEIWPIELIKEENIWARSPNNSKVYEVPFDDYLFFAGAGVDGILFAFSVSSSKVEENGIYAWYPIRGVIRKVTQSLETFITEWIGGNMSL